MATDPPAVTRTVINLDMTGAEQPLPERGREAFEREAAWIRGAERGEEPLDTLCAPTLPGLRPDLIYTLVAQNVRDYAIFLMDQDGIIRCWGEGARLMKWWTRHQAEGSHLRMLYPDGGSEDGTCEEHLQHAADHGEYTGEGHRVRNDGSTFWAYVTLTALRNPEGALVGFTKVTRDFSARRAVEASLKRDPGPESQQTVDEANRLKRLLATMSHEVRTPLSAMLGSVSLLEHEIGADEKQRAHLARLERNGRHLLEIIEDVLALARAEAGHLQITPAAHRLGRAIEEAIADVQGEADERGVTLSNSVSGAATDLPYYGDESRVRQIIVNLLSNGIKFTGQDGRVTISGGTGLTVAGAKLAGKGPWIYVRVEDTGRGIPIERQEAIFEPYRQAEPGDEAHGAGLGLAISRQLARLMGGDLTVQSEVGVGSSFTLWLPIAPSDPIPI